MIDILINFTYVISTLLFIIGLKKLSSPATARKGNIISSLGMGLAIIVTLLDQNIISYEWIIFGIVVGTIIGVLGARLVSMTSMPEMVALLNGFGGLSSLLVGWGVFHATHSINLLIGTTIVLSIVIGGVTFSGSFIAWLKLKELISGKPFLFPGQKIINSLILIGLLITAYLFNTQPECAFTLLLVMIGLSILLGILSVLSIGGGDMPVVISLLNSYSGLAACAAGFVIQNTLLIVAGSLVGASGIILTQIMCKSMNRSLTNVLFSGFGSGKTQSKQVEGTVNPITVEDAYYILESAQSAVVVPGYGLAVAQAQHVVKEFGQLLEANGCDVKYAIHPVAGRMPGHMNVLLAEADVPYDQLVEMDDINPIIESVDVCIVIGANDVVNPDARDNKESTIYGMPIINVDKARTAFVLKRSMSPGFAGIQNPLFFKENTRMLFGDAKQSVQGLISEFKG
ncbi:NAD(P)(+) transhydrogenase (Re/Si-specific) subunit beta [bacterium]|jgi:H+-translocating NAD(P) transhydrogenase subunit beta|nr:NAD(P)(+) transhydrogenase (Re/Si-specific) subunit beta [bacterium]